MLEYLCKVLQTIHIQFCIIRIDILLAPQRHALILEDISKSNSVSIRALSDKLDVSRETIRKDIEHLSERNELTQVRGGAVRVQTVEPHISSRASTNPEGKNKIANIAVNLIPDGSSIIIDNGSTTQAIARALLWHHKDLVIYTNDLKIAEILIPTAREIIVLGGRVDPNELATHGLETIESLSKYRTQFSFVSAGGLNANDLFSDFTHEAAALRSCMLSHAEQPILVVDQNKFGAIGQVKLSPIPVATKVITDTEPPISIVEALEMQSLNLRWK